MRQTLSLLLLTSALAITACSDNQTQQTNNKAADETTSQETPVIANTTGAGASFPQPVYAQWAQSYQQETKNQVNYQSIGSSGGVKQIVSKTVDFGASDAPLKPEELAEQGLVQFPTVIGGVVPVINIDGIEAGQLKLSGELLADIYLGKITKWNDSKIAALNPDVTLPDTDIITVFRSDGSGTSFNFTNYLTKTSADWADKVGTANSVKWPTAETGTGTAGKGNEGVSAVLNKVKNSIGYVEYAYAKQNNIAHVALINKAGNTVQPSQETFAAAAKTDWQNAPGFYLIITDQADENAWPIASATFIIMHKTVDDTKKAQDVLAFFDWAYNKGDDQASNLDYVPLPNETKELIRASWAEIVDTNGASIYSK